MVLERFLRDIDSSDVIGAGNIRSFLLTLQDGHFKPGTVHIYYRSLKTFFNWLVAEDMIGAHQKANPVDRMNLK